MVCGEVGLQKKRLKADLCAFFSVGLLVSSFSTLSSSFICSLFSTSESPYLGSDFGFSQGEVSS